MVGLTRKERRRINRAKQEKFIKYFRFFLQSYRKGITTFTGSNLIETKLNLKKPDAKYCFTAFNNGEYSLDTPIETKHPNVLKAVINGKKSWGLWSDEWGNGIAEYSFTENEILSIFQDDAIEIPDSLLSDFKNSWQDKRRAFQNNPKSYLNLKK